MKIRESRRGNSAEKGVTGYGSMLHAMELEQLHGMERERENRPFADLTFYGDHPLMSCCDLFDNRKPKTGSA